MENHSADPLYCGVDVGASSTKLVLLDQDREVRGRSIRRSGVDYAATARACLLEAVDEAGAETGQIRRIVPTGYGRRLGTGAFREEIALRLDVEPEELERLASSTSEAVRLNSFCTVFASTEILSHLRRGEPLAGLIRGAFASVVNRVAEMDRLDGRVVLTGGVVAHNPTTAEIFADKVGGEVKVPPHPQFTGALGAALTALAQEEKNA